MFPRHTRQAYAPVSSTGGTACCQSALETLFWQWLEVDAAGGGGSARSGSGSSSNGGGSSFSSAYASQAGQSLQSFEVRLVAIREGARYEVRACGRVGMCVSVNSCDWC